MAKFGISKDHPVVLNVPQLETQTSPNRAARTPSENWVNMNPVRDMTLRWRSTNFATPDVGSRLPKGAQEVGRRNQNPVLATSFECVVGKRGNLQSSHSWWCTTCLDLPHIHPLDSRPRNS